MQQPARSLLSDSRQAKQWEKPSSGILLLGMIKEQYVIRAGAGKQDHLLSPFHAELLGYAQQF
jgi:hypothetical protein